MFALGFRVECLGFRVECLVFRVHSLGFRDIGLGFREDASKLIVYATPSPWSHLRALVFIGEGTRNTRSNHVTAIRSAWKAAPATRFTLKSGHVLRKRMGHLETFDSGCCFTKHQRNSASSIVFVNRLYENGSVKHTIISRSSEQMLEFLSYSVRCTCSSIQDAK